MNIMIGAIWVQTCSESIVAKAPRMAGVLSEWQGCSDAWRNVDKAGAHRLTGVALLSVVRKHCLVVPDGGAKPLV